MASKELPVREANVFKKIARCYEDKQFKIGLKHCQKILSTPGLSNHGETLSMKALLLNATDKKEEAYECARLGLRHGITSHVCWHAFGLIHRSDKNYAEAIKCYRQALKIEKNSNLQILRDLSVLQIQMRDLPGYTETRRTILTIRPAQRASWLGYAVAEHLQGNLELAVAVITSYEQTIEMPPRDETDLLDVSELSLYKASLLTEQGKFQEALDYLKASAKHITDKTGLREVTLHLLTQLGRPEAELVARDMFRLNPDNRDYLVNLENAKGLTHAATEKRLAFYQSLEKEFPFSRVLRRVPLTLATGEQFVAIADDYLRKGLRKGIVSLFRSIQSLYASPEKAAAVEKLLVGYVTNLNAGNKFDSDATVEELPSTHIWALYALAQHFDRTGNHEQALVHINAAIEHTPTLVDLYMIKAKILKHQGKFVEAAEVMDIGRDLDTADRYLNCKAVKYFLRAGNVAKAETLAALFTRDGNNDPIAQLTEMQCTWFEMEEARAFLQTGAIGKALKKLHSIDSHFTQYVDDQFDFHSFCFRKMTLRAYIRLLRFEDTLHGHKYFVRAALLAIATYVGLHDKPFVVASEKAAADELAGLSEDERKKFLSRQRKAAKRAEAQQPQPKAEEEKPGDKPKDTDPEGLKLAKTATPLEDAIKFLRPLLIHARDNIEVHLAAFEIYSRKKKPLLMLQALVRANTLEVQNPRLVQARSEFLTFVAAEGKTWNPKVIATVRHEVTSGEAFKSADVDLAKLF